MTRTCHLCFTVPIRAVAGIMGPCMTSAYTTSGTALVLSLEMLSLLPNKTQNSFLFRLDALCPTALTLSISEENCLSHDASYKNRRWLRYFNADLVAYSLSSYLHLHNLSNPTSFQTCQSLAGYVTSGEYSAVPTQFSDLSGSQRSR